MHFSCFRVLKRKEAFLSMRIQVIHPVSATADAQLKFAKLLSQAASSNVEVRSFLKKEALAQFDNDYDIFYPMIKDKKVFGDQSFRDVLLSYCKEANELSEIEQSLPLLNIMIPDLSLFWDFNAATWDTSDKEVAVLCRDDKNNTLYENGENIGNMTNGDIPGFPCLVVKNNERMKITSVNTRSEKLLMNLLVMLLMEARKFRHGIMMLIMI